MGKIVSAASFLVLLLSTAGCTSTSMETPAPGGAAVVRPPPSEATKDYPISVRFNQAEIKMVIELIARSSNLNIILNPGVSGAVTYSSDQTPARKILEEVVHQCGLRLIPETAGILRVAAP